MNEQQRQTIRDFIELHNSKVITHLRSFGLLNNNRTLPRGEGVEINLERWFFDSISYTLGVTDAGGVEVILEIGSFDSAIRVRCRRMAFSIRGSRVGFS